MTLWYVEERAYAKAHALAQHTLQEIELCADYATRAGSSHEGVSSLQTTTLHNVIKLLVVTHSKLLQGEFDESEALSKKMGSVKLATMSTCKPETLYNSLYDTLGQTKTAA